jgi:hypothetical protein
MFFDVVTKVLIKFVGPTGFSFLNTKWLLFTIIKFQITINDPWIPSHPFDRDIVVKMALTHASKSCSANATVTIKCKDLGR